MSAKTAGSVEVLLGASQPPSNAVKIDRLTNEKKYFENKKTMQRSPDRLWRIDKLPIQNSRIYLNVLSLCSSQGRAATNSARRAKKTARRKKGTKKGTKKGPERQC
jgi:hypothetical protein